MEYPWLMLGDCIERMKEIPDGSVEMILCDLPYGTTACKWDTVIPFEPLWEQYLRVIKENNAVVLFGSQPFSSAVVVSKNYLYRHSWVYKKSCPTNFVQAQYAPLKEHEDVLVFSKKKANFYPIKEERKGSGASRVKYKFSDKSTLNNGEFLNTVIGIPKSSQDKLRFPSSVQAFNNRAKGDIGLHPTQKPVALLEYLIRTYTNEGEIVLDNCMGSGSTGVACVNTKRKFIGIEKDEKYFAIAENRIKAAAEEQDQMLFG
jgi:site-specific DNA-methyltransferase (adenine-specific)